MLGVLRVCKNLVQSLEEQLVNGIFVVCDGVTVEETVSRVVGALFELSSRRQLNLAGERVDDRERACVGRCESV